MRRPDGAAGSDAVDLIVTAIDTSCTLPTDMTNTGKHCEQDSVSNRQSDLFTLDPIAGSHCHCHCWSLHASPMLDIAWRVNIDITAPEEGAGLPAGGLVTASRPLPAHCLSHCWHAWLSQARQLNSCWPLPFPYSGTGFNCRRHSSTAAGQCRSLTMSDCLMPHVPIAAAAATVGMKLILGAPPWPARPLRSAATRRKRVRC